MMFSIDAISPNRRNITVNVQNIIAKLARLLNSDSSRVLLVGGCVRDELMGKAPKDFDVEVFGVQPDQLLARLSGAGLPLDLVGKSFGVIKLKGLPVDISIPRRENKAGVGHKGFEIHSDPSLSPAEAALRRDFTINAIFKDPLTGEVLDFHDGIQDLRQGVLRPTSEKFCEDPLRVLRAMQFLSRFKFQPDRTLLELSRTMTMEGLPQERIFDEFRKWLLQGVELKRGFDFLRDSTWIRFFPDLAAMVGVPQDPEWHPEGDVFTHTGHCLNAFAELRSGVVMDDLAVGFAVLLHDIAKPQTTVFADDRWRSPGHDERGRMPTECFMRSLTREAPLIVQVVELVAAHMIPTQLFLSGASESAVRRLAMRVGRLDLLARVVTSDKRGRPPILCPDVPECDWLLAMAQKLAIAASKPRPLLMGRHLIALGMVPGPHMGQILEAVFEAQLDGHVTSLEAAIVLARQKATEQGLILSNTDEALG